jgi:hypothetical protein
MNKAKSMVYAEDRLADPGEFDDYAKVWFALEDKGIGMESLPSTVTVVLRWGKNLDDVCKALGTFALSLLFRRSSQRRTFQSSRHRFFE